MGKGCTRLAIVRDKVCQLPAHGQRFPPGTPASSTTKTDRHDMAEILLKVALNPIQSINQLIEHHIVRSRFIYFSHFCLMLNKQNIGLLFCNYNRGGIVRVLQTQTPFKVYTIP